MWIIPDSIYTVVFMCVEQYVKVKTLKIYTFLWPVKWKEKKQFYAILFLTLSDDVKEVSALLVLFGY